MEVLANGMKANFWVPVEEEPDIDRFVDEQIMIDMDRFMLVGTLEKVSTCKKKNEEKEFEYFKQITVQVNNICLASENNFNITIPGKKDEFLYEVKFRYTPEPEQVTGEGMKPTDHIEEAGRAAEAEEKKDNINGWDDAEQAEADAIALKEKLEAAEKVEPVLDEENDLEAGYKNSEGQDVDREQDAEAELVKHIDDGAGDEIAKEVAEKLAEKLADDKAKFEEIKAKEDAADQKKLDEYKADRDLDIEGDQVGKEDGLEFVDKDGETIPGKPLVEVLDGDGDDEFFADMDGAEKIEETVEEEAELDDDQYSFDDEPVCNAIVDEDDLDPEDEDNEDIDWGEEA